MMKQQQQQQTTVVVRPFMSIDEQMLGNNGHYRSQQNVMSLERQVEKKVESNDFIQVAPQYHDNKQQFTTVNKFITSLAVPATNLDSDFLKRID